MIRFIGGAPYEDIAFRIVDREWDYSAKRERGFKSSFDKVYFALLPIILSPVLRATLHTCAFDHTLLTSISGYLTTSLPIQEGEQSLYLNAPLLVY